MTFNGVGRSYSVHRLVAQAFIPNPLNLPQVNHLDGDRYNNRSDNLEWTDQSGNMRHAINNGLVRILRGTERKTAKLNPDLVREIRQRLDGGASYTVICREFGISRSRVSFIRHRTAWAHVD